MAFQKLNNQFSESINLHRIKYSSPYWTWNERWDTRSYITGTVPMLKWPSVLGTSPGLVTIKVYREQVNVDIRICRRTLGRCKIYFTAFRTSPFKLAPPISTSKIRINLRCWMRAVCMHPRNGTGSGLFDFLLKNKTYTTKQQPARVKAIQSLQDDIVEVDRRTGKALWNWWNTKASGPYTHAI